MTKSTENKALPPHIQALIKAMEARQQKFGFTITDVTPDGYGPRG
jgi:hypothetical protein